MVPDLAFNITARSEQVERASQSLGRLAGAARQVDAALKGMTTGTAGAVAAVSRADAVTRGYSRAANSNAAAARSSGLQMRMVAMQLSQVAQQTQVTGHFMQALAIQLPDLALGFGAFGIAMGVVAGVMLQFVNGGKLAATALNGLADILVDIAPYAVAAAAALALLYAPAMLAGLTALSEAILGITARLAGMAIGFALANPATVFVAGIIAAVAAANIFRDELTRILGVDIVGAAKDTVNAIIGFFIGSYNGIVAAWGMLPAALGDLGYQAADRFYVAITEMLRNLRVEINSFIEGINSKLGTAIPTIGGGLIGLNADGTQRHIANHHPDAASGAAEAFQGAFDAAQGTDYVGGAYDYIAKGASAASGKLKELAEWLGKVDEKKKKSHGKTDAEKYSDIVDGANRRIASLQAEYDALGMTDMAAAKLTYETDLLNQAQQKGITLSATQKAELSDLAGRMAALEIATKNAKDAMAFAQDITKGFVNDLRSGLEQGKGIWESFGNAALNVLDKIADKLLDDVLDAIFKVNSASASSGGGFWSILGSLFGLGGGGGGFSSWDYAVADLGQGLFAAGGYTGHGGKYEPAGVVHRGEYVFSAAATRAIGVGNLDRAHRRARGYAGGGYVDNSVLCMLAPSNQNSAPVVQIIDQRSGGTIEQEETDSGLRLIVRDEIKKSGVGSVGQFARNHAEAKKRSMIK